MYTWTVEVLILPLKYIFGGPQSFFMFRHHCWSKCKWRFIYHKHTYSLNSNRCFITPTLCHSKQRTSSYEEGALLHYSSGLSSDVLHLYLGCNELRYKTKNTFEKVWFTKALAIMEADVYFVVLHKNAIHWACAVVGSSTSYASSGS